jgi:hypothetical protein
VVVALACALMTTACGRSVDRAPRAGDEPAARPAAADTTAVSDTEPTRPGASGLPEGPGESAAGAAAVVRDYYRAIDEHRYRDAYRLWGSEGAASGKSFEEFEAGFARTTSTAVEVGRPGPMGAAAGSRYVEIPVRVIANHRDEGRQVFAGTYTLRRSVVDGATPAQRTWHLYSARIERDK